MMPVAGNRWCGFLDSHKMDKVELATIAHAERAK
jgi:hypothetical protein